MLGDLRVLHLISMLGLVVTGVLHLDFSVSLLQIFSTYFIAFIYYIVIDRKEDHNPRRILSLFITSTSIVLLFRSQFWFGLGLAFIISLIGKKVFRFQGKHFFNPAGFGIVITYFFVPGNWISPGQWGNNFSILFSLLVLGFFLVRRVNRLDISLYFLVSYFLFLLIYHSWLGWEFAVTIKKVFSGPLILFTFFMISDPRTSPNHSIGRFLQGFLSAFLALIFSEIFFRSEALLLALIITTVLNPLWDIIFPQKFFEWETTYDQKANHGPSPSFNL